MSRSKASPCYGIDLGTTASAIGLVRHGVPRLLEIHGDNLLPSAVLFPAEGAPLVGHPALNAMPLDPERGVLSSKRMMGSNHRYSIGDREVSPVDVAEQILRALVEAAAATTGEAPKRVVITVPAWFTQAQRADTRLAGERAGLTVERVINEPTAAALAHAHGQDLRRRVLVYDLGGGTFDVSLVEQDGPLVEVKASHGDSWLGGDDVDLALMDEVLHRLAETDRPLREAVDRSAAARLRLRLEVERAKVALSEQTTTTLRVPFLLDLDGRARHLEMTLERADVDEAAAPFVERTLAAVDQVLADAGVGPQDIDELLLVGGSTLQPLVWHTLRDRYGLEGSHAINPRQVVALGAAIQGAIVDGSRTDGILVDVAPYSLSVGVASGEFPGMLTHFGCRVITPRNTPLPSRHSEVLSTMGPTQSELRLPIFQGSSRDPRKNTILGEIRMTGIPPAPAGEYRRPIRVGFRHDLNGMVQIEITDVLSGRTVNGHVAADGDEQAELRAGLEELLSEHYEPLEDDTPVRAAPAPAAPVAPHVDDVQSEAGQTFAAVLGARSRLLAENPEDAEALLALAEAGQEALAARRSEDVIARYDALSDRLFELGVYL